MRDKKTKREGKEGRKGENQKTMSDNCGYLWRGLCHGLEFWGSLIKNIISRLFKSSFRSRFGRAVFRLIFS